MPLWRLFETSKARRARLREEEKARERKRNAESQRARKLETTRARIRNEEWQRQRQEFLIAQEADALVESGFVSNPERARALVIRQREKHRARTKLLAHACVFILVGLYLLANNLIAQSIIGLGMLFWCIGLFWQGFQYHAEHGLATDYSLAASDSRRVLKRKQKNSERRRYRRLSIDDLSEDGELSDAFLHEEDTSRRRRFR